MKLKSYLVDVAFLAAFLGISERRVQQLVKLGMPRAARGQYDLLPCAKWYVEFLQEELKKRSPATQPENAGIDAERARLVAAQADRAEIEVAVRRGDLMFAPHTEAAWADAIHRARERLLAMPVKLGPQLTNVSDPSECARAIESEVHAALDELARRQTGDARSGSASAPGSVGDVLGLPAEVDGERVGGHVPDALDGGVGGTGEVED
jgi:phage terminase Nu1 subunit (DNA packaging protein)